MKSRTKGMIVKCVATAIALRASFLFTGYLVFEYVVMAQRIVCYRNVYVILFPLSTAKVITESQATHRNFFVAYFSAHSHAHMHLHTSTTCAGCKRYELHDFVLLLLLLPSLYIFPVGCSVLFSVVLGGSVNLHFPGN